MSAFLAFRRNIIRWRLFCALAVVIVAATAPSTGLAAAAEVETWQRNMKTAVQAMKDDKPGEALQAMEAALAAAREFEKTDPRLGATHTQFARMYGHTGRDDKAEEHFRAALETLQRAMGDKHPLVALAYGDLGNFYRVRRSYVRAEQLLRKSIALLIETMGPAHPEVGRGLNNLGTLMTALGRYGEAVSAFKTALENWESSLDPGHPQLGVVYSNLGDAQRAQGEYEAAQQSIARSLDIREKAFGSSHPSVSVTLNSMASLQRQRGRYKDAEASLRRALAIRERAFGKNDPRVASVLNNLAELMRERGRYDAALPIYTRASEILLENLGGDSPRYGRSLNNIGALYARMGKPEESIYFFGRGIAVLEEALGTRHTRLAAAFNNLAGLYHTLGNFNEATRYYTRAQDIYEETLGRAHPLVGEITGDIGSLFRQQGLLGLADNMLARSLKIFEQGLGKSHVRTSIVLSEMAALRFQQGRAGEALELIRRAFDILGRDVADHLAAQSELVKRGGAQRVFDHLIQIAYAMRQLGEGDARALAENAFRAGQLSLAAAAGPAVRNLRDRYAAGNDALAAVLRNLKDEKEKWLRLDALLTAVAGKPVEARRRLSLSDLQSRLESQGARLRTLEKELEKEYPDFTNLAGAHPVALSDVQASLQPGEAALVYHVGIDVSFLWVIRHDKFTWLPLKVGRGAIDQFVRRLRKSLDVDNVASLNDIPVFDTDAAFELYRLIFEPAEKSLLGVGRLMVAPDGALQSLPFHVLLSAPAGAPEKFSDYRKLPWLGNAYAMSTLPTVSTLKTIRRDAPPSKASQAFLGIGDPDLDGKATALRGIGSRLFAARGLADVDALRKLPVLPETEDELTLMAEAFGMGREALLLDDDASETGLRARNLADIKVIAFATHGLVAEDLGELGEPALVLTPPDEKTLEDDGLLTASEIARLKLDADLVILSACNTAAPDRTLGAAGLAGLARSLFHAGARSLLVSHWPVSSEAAVKLTTGLMSNVESSSNRAVAFKRAVSQVRNDEEAVFAHPAFWAPFVLIGTGD